MVAEEEFAMLYMLAALLILSARLLVLMLFLWSEKASLLGLGRAPAPAALSLEIPILPGLENSLTFDFSFEIGLSGCICGYSVGGNPGDDPGDFGNTTLAAV
jgi:hypothetical protein